MDEARQIKQLLYPLSRDVRNLSIFSQNVQHVLQSPPSRLTIGGLISLMTLRQTVKGLLTSAKTLLEVDEIIIKESAIGEVLSHQTMTLVLRPAAHLNDVARDKKIPLERLNSQVSRLSAYLNPLFLFAMSNLSVADTLRQSVGLMEQRLAVCKKSVCRLADQELVSDLPAVTEQQLRALRPQLKERVQEIADISHQVALLMGKLNRQQDYVGQLEPVLRMAAAMDNALDALKPAMRMLKQLGKAFHQVQRQAQPYQSISQPLSSAFAGAQLPMDALFQLEVELKRCLDQTVEPMLVPLADLVERVKNSPPNAGELKGLESMLATQQSRFSHAERLLSRHLKELQQVAEQAQPRIHVA